MSGRLREARAALLHQFHDPVMRDGVDVAYCIDGECHGVIYVVDGVEEVRRTHSERCHVAPYLEALAADEHGSLDAATLWAVYREHREKWHVHIAQQPNGQCIEECMNLLAVALREAQP